MTVSAENAKLAIDGGTPIRNIAARAWPRWPIYDEREERALLETLHSGNWWSVEGTQGTEFEGEFASFQQAKHGVACTNGTAALEIALRALGIGCGDEVIVPPYSFVATASAVVTVGATPVFIDIEGDTLNIDPRLIADAITPRTRAIIPAYIAGRPADLDSIMAAAKKYDLRVIEDAAQAHGAEWRGRKVGAIGDFGTFSFQASKNLNAGEGGIILSDDVALSDAAWSVVNVGRVRDGRWYEHPVLGGNYRLTEFQSALLRIQLTRLPEQSVRRTKNAHVLRELLAGIEGIQLPRLDERITCHAYHLFTFRYQPEQFARRSLDAFVAALMAEGIPCSTGYVPLYKEGIFAKRTGAQSAGLCRAGRAIDYGALCLPVCEAVCADTVWLPQTLLLGTAEDMSDIAAAIFKIQHSYS